MAGRNPVQTPVKAGGMTLSDKTSSTPNENRPFPKGSSSWVRECLAGHNIFIDHDVFESDHYQEFKQLVLAPFEVDRDVVDRPSSVEKYKQVYHYYKDLNEASFKTEILRLIIKLDFEWELEPATETCPAVYGPSDNWNQGLRIQYDQSVNRGHLLHTYNDPHFEQRKVQDALKKEGVLNAEPDAVLGFDPKEMPSLQLHPDTRELLLLPKMSWPFFVIQSKQANGNFEVACNEAARDGVAVVSAARKLCQKAGFKIDTPGPDTNTYIYSAVMDTKVMEWYVHWAEVTEQGDVRYHMNTVVENRLLKQEHALRDLRGPTHAILEWGLRKRKPAVQAWYERLAESGRQDLLKKSAKAPAATSQTTTSELSAANKRLRLNK